MKSGYYILDADGEPIPVDDVLTWARWFESHGDERRIAQDRLPDGRLVSTVFLGHDHQFGSGPPLIFETMTFGPEGESGNECYRYSTRAEAIEGHVSLVAELLGFSGKVNDA